MRNRERYMIFRQSLRDFPCPVTLGDKTPSFGLNRFKQGLKFVLPDDEGFTLRGDKKQLIYKGRRRSHRFTILGNGSFEYDCILKKEPDSNIIRLRIEGAENFDFLLQPDFVKEPFLKGSYAVYKKQTLLGEGTGKLCHIHRPEIIDARGRRCWGELIVVGNELQITIPEKWLGEAAYPVVVDPVIGTTTIGSQDLYMYHYVSIYGYEWDCYDQLYCNDTMILNKVLISENISGMGTFYVYKNGDFMESRITRPYPCMYNNINNLPNTKISVNEQAITDPYEMYEAEWVQAGISKNCAINAGDYIWFGVSADNLNLKFDYGGILEIADIHNSYIYNNTVLPNVLGDNFFSPFVSTEYNRVLRVSMYINFEESGNTYKKILVDTARINMTLNAAKIKEIFIEIIDRLIAEGTVIRNLFISLRILTNKIFRSYISKRFLNARIEITLKSRIGETNRSEQ